MGVFQNSRKVPQGIAFPICSDNSKHNTIQTVTVFWMLVNAFSIVNVSHLNNDREPGGSLHEQTAHFMGLVDFREVIWGR